MKKIISLVLALAMVLMVGAAFASTITVTPPTGIDENASNTYNLYKIFDAIVNAEDNTKVSYKLPEGIMAPPAGFSVDAAGNVSYTGTSTNLTATDIEAIKTYIETNSLRPIATDTVTGSNPAEFDNLDAGYYFIDTTTGTLVTVQTNNENLTLVDKNTVPSLDKEIIDASGSITDGGQLDTAGKAALAQVGTDVLFNVDITVGKGMKDYVLHDTMSDGLALNTDSVSITYLPDAPAGYEQPTIKTGTDADEGDDLTIEFANGLPENTIITVGYSAKVTNEALTVDPENNTAKVEYGDGPTHGFTPEVTTETHSAKIGVLKVDGSNSDTALAGAGFKLYKMSGTEKLYYHYDSSTKTVSWGAKDAGDERFTNDQGAIEAFVGLNDGTYYLEETTVPDGYNAPLTDETVTINGTDYTAENLEQVKTIRNNQGTVLPSTGGIGTTIFYIVGGLLLVGAAVVLVARRKASN